MVAVSDCGLNHEKVRAVFQMERGASARDPVLTISDSPMNHFLVICKQQQLPIYRQQKPNVSRRCKSAAMEQQPGNTVEYGHLARSPQAVVPPSEMRDKEKHLYTTTTR